MATTHGNSGGSHAGKSHDTKAHDAKSGDDKAGDAALPKGEVAEDIRGLVTTLKGDLTKLAGTKADKAIGHWETLLESVGPGAKAIHTDLGKLREHVTASDPDGKAIGRLLGSLGTKVTKVAEDQGGVVGTALKSLASALEHAAGSLGEDGGDEKTTTTKAKHTAK